MWIHIPPTHRPPACPPTCPPTLQVPDSAVGSAQLRRGAQQPWWVGQAGSGPDGHRLPPAAMRPGASRSPTWSPRPPGRLITFSLRSHAGACWLTQLPTAATRLPERQRCPGTALDAARCSTGQTDTREHALVPPPRRRAVPRAGQHGAGGAVLPGGAQRAAQLPAGKCAGSALGTPFVHSDGAAGKLHVQCAWAAPAPGAGAVLQPGSLEALPLRQNGPHTPLAAPALSAAFPT